MSLAVDQYLLEQMRKEDDLDLMLDTDISGNVIDHLCGWDEETQTFERNQGMLFPQPIRKIE